MSGIKKGQFTVTSSKTIYKNPWIEVTEDSVIRPEGDRGIFGTVDMKDGVAILPLFSDGTVLLAREYKYAQDSEMIEIIGGGIDEGEAPEQAAARELAEEAGIGAGHFKSIGVTDPFTTLVRTRDHLIIATELYELAARPPADDMVEPFNVSLNTAVEYVLNGSITHTTSCLLILRAAFEYPQYVNAKVAGL
ncbi:NUDIX domain-containing protein [Vreelandella alkaliphila]|uniref:NUDIX domain-containing protein n=1 Tax=Vreelandella alkaliphila TaxID=272774 RepID=UPI003FD8E6EF